MKRALLALILALPLALSAQFRIVGTGLFTTLNDSTYRAKIDFRPDLTGNSYNATQLNDSMLVLSQKGQLYRLDSFYNASFSSAFIIVVEKNGNWGSPVGQIMVFQNNSSLAAPQAVYGANGATAGMQAGVDTWNSLLLKVVSDSAVYWNQAYSNSIDSLNVSGDSLKTITLYRAGGDSISATFVDGGGSGPVTDTLYGEVKGPLDSTYIDTVANIIFRLDSTTVGVGELKYNDTQGSIQQGLKGGNVTNVIGQQLHQRVLNKTGSPLAKGEAVYLQGSQGNRITVAKAIATIDSTSANTFGIVAESIANNQSGYVITEGLITNMNTNALTEGAAVYLSPTVAGELTTTKPQAPQHTVYIGVCVKQNAGSGELFVKIRNGQELDELHDVRIDSLASNASLYYNAAQGVWRDTGAAVLVADTSAMLTNYINVVDTAAMLTNYINIADTATMLSSYISNADTSVFARDFQISGTAGQVAYFNAANAVTSDTAFRWSAANKTLGINTSTTSGANIIIKNSQEPSRSTVVSTQTFAADTTNWTRGTGWTFNGTAAVATAATGDLTYTPALTITSGNAYEVTYTLSGYSAGTLTVAVGNATYSLPRYNVTSNVVVLFPTSASGGFRFTTSTFTGNVDNVSVVQIANQAPVLFAGQDDNASTLYNSLRMPNSTTLAFSGGGGYSTGLNNNFLGALTGQGTTTGAGNNFFGSNAGRLNTTGSNNNFFGTLAGDRNTTGSNNNFFGTSAGQISTTGSNNNFLGSSAGASNTTGSNNNFLGSSAGASNTTGSNNNFFGTLAGASNTTGSDNNFFGNQAGTRNTSGVDNNFFGSGAGFRNTTGENNVFIGNEAGYNNSTGNANIFIGLLAGQTNTIGSSNTFFGNQAGTSNTTASNNVFMGTFSGQNTTTGGSNFFLGNQSGRYNVSGTSNFLLGDGAGLWHRSGASNIFIGTNTGPQTAADTLSGSNNIIIGRNAADNIRAAAAGNVAIGNQVDLPTSNGSNQGVYQNVLFFTGASGTGTTIAAGSRAGIKTNAPASDFHVAGEVRIDDLKPTGTPRNIVGSSSTGDLSTMAWGNGLTVSVGDTILRADTSVLASKTWVNNEINADTISLSNRINTKLNISDTSVFARDFQISGTANYIPKFTAGNQVGNSWFSQSDSVMTLNDAKKMQLYGRNGRRNYLEIFRGGTNTMQTNYVLATDTAYTASTGTTSRVYTHAVDNQNADYMISTYSGGGTGGFILLDALRTGIGLNNPVNRLDVEGAAAIGATYAGGFTAPTNGLLVEGNVGIATSSPSRPLHVAGTTAIRIPVGNLAERGTSGAGDIRVRSDTANLEFHNGTSWQTVINNADTSVFARDVQISGTTNRLAMFTGSNTVGNSVVDVTSDTVSIRDYSNSYTTWRFHSNINKRGFIGYPSGTRFYSLVNPSLYAGFMYGDRSAGVQDQQAFTQLTAYNGGGAASGFFSAATTLNGADSTLSFNISGLSANANPTFPAAQMVIQKGGNVGLNTTTPTAKLHINNPSSTTPALNIVSNSNVIGSTNDAVSINMQPGQVNQNNTGVRVFNTITGTSAEGSNTGIAVSLNARNSSYGVYSAVSKNWGGSSLFGEAIGVYGSATTDSPAGFSYGGYFKNDTTQGTGFGVFVQTTTPKGSGTVTPLAIQHNSTELMRVQSDGNVGIATSSPSRPLHVAGTTAIRIPVGNFAQRGTSGAGDIRVRNDTANLEFHNGTSWQTVINNSDTSVFARDVQISGTANRLAMFTGSNAVGNSIVTQNGRSMYINSTQDNSGYTISNLFQFNGFGSSPTDQPSIGVIGNVGTNSVLRPYFAMYRSAGSTVNDKTLVPYNYYLGSITWQGADGTDFQPRGAEITAITDSITGENDMPTALFFGTTANGQEQPTERMRITSAGNVGINTTTPSRRLHVEGETRISDLTTDPATRIVGADADGDLDAITIGNGVTFSSDTLKADTSVLATKTYVTDNAISTVYMPINLYAPGDTVANTTNSKAFFLVHSGLNGYCIDSYTVKAFSGSGTADIQIDKNGSGGNLQAISGTTTATKDTNIALATGDYIRGQVFNLSGTLVGLGLTLEIKKTCN